MLFSVEFLFAFVNIYFWNIVGTEGTNCWFSIHDPLYLEANEFEYKDVKEVEIFCNANQRSNESSNKTKYGFNLCPIQDLKTLHICILSSNRFNASKITNNEMEACEWSTKCVHVVLDIENNSQLLKNLGYKIYIWNSHYGLTCLQLSMTNDKRVMKSSIPVFTRSRYTSADLYGFLSREWLLYLTSLEIALVYFVIGSNLPASFYLGVYSVLYVGASPKLELSRLKSKLIEYVKSFSPSVICSSCMTIRLWKVMLVCHLLVMPLLSYIIGLAFFREHSIECEIVEVLVRMGQMVLSTCPISYFAVWYIHVIKGNVMVAFCILILSYMFTPISMMFWWNVLGPSIVSDELALAAAYGVPDPHRGLDLMPFKVLIIHMVLMLISMVFGIICTISTKKTGHDIFFRKLMDLTDIFFPLVSIMASLAVLLKTWEFLAVCSYEQIGAITCFIVGSFGVGGMIAGAFSYSSKNILIIAIMSAMQSGPICVIVIVCASNGRENDKAPQVTYEGAAAIITFIATRMLPCVAYLLFKFYSSCIGTIPEDYPCHNSCRKLHYFLFPSSLSRTECECKVDTVCVEQSKSIYKEIGVNEKIVIPKSFADVKLYPSYEGHEYSNDPVQPSLKPYFQENSNMNQHFANLKTSQNEFDMKELWPASSEQLHKLWMI